MKDVEQFSLLWCCSLRFNYWAVSYYPDLLETTEQYFSVVLVIMQHKTVPAFHPMDKSKGVTIQIKAI